VPFETLRRLVISVFDSFREQGYMQEAFGIECVDGDSSGRLGDDPDAYFLRVIGREGIWPYWTGTGFLPPRWEAWDEDTLFDVVEVMHDLVSKPVEGRRHDYNNCGMHYSVFDRAAGQQEYRDELNRVLRMGDPPYRLNDLGLLVERGPAEFQKLLQASVPAGTEHDLITSKIEAAVSRFERRGATVIDRRDAVRDLADALEALRSEIKDSMMTADEKAMFHLANGFSIRHHNRDQRGDYDKPVWLQWAFYVYLATIHAVLRVRELPES
jgi:hypothetical protein